MINPIYTKVYQVYISECKIPIDFMFTKKESGECEVFLLNKQVKGLYLKALNYYIRKKIDSILKIVSLSTDYKIENTIKDEF
jgi:hypothetical protein